MQEEDKNIKISIRKFEFYDIPNKVRWINNPVVNRFLHYDLPLEIEKTEKWFLNNQDRTDRIDDVIMVNGQPVGLIGLLSIDYERRDAEYYIAIGEPEFFGRGVAKQASIQLLHFAFSNLALKKVYLSTEQENCNAICLYRKLGFSQVKNQSPENNKKVFFEMHAQTFKDAESTPIVPARGLTENELYVKREDLIPFSFGGNKARKAKYFFEEIDNGSYNCVVTYGSSSSNHCRVVSNMAKARGIPCIIISPQEASVPTYNSKMMELFGAQIKIIPVSEVHDTIEQTIEYLRSTGKHPYFIPGGGHGNLGTGAYVDCYREIKRYEEENHIFFDDIFVASGTGTTQAGLVCGQLMFGDERNIVGISIARKNPRGRQIVVDSIHEYLKEKKINVSDNKIESATVFCDDYTGEGYGYGNSGISDTIQKMLFDNGIPLDSTYTGKAYYGMVDYLSKQQIKNHRILFIHTGGTPLFFDDLAKEKL